MCPNMFDSLSVKRNSKCCKMACRDGYNVHDPNDVTELTLGVTYPCMETNLRSDRPLSGPWILGVTDPLSVIEF